MRLWMQVASVGRVRYGSGGRKKLGRQWKRIVTSWSWRNWRCESRAVRPYWTDDANCVHMGRSGLMTRLERTSKVCGTNQSSIIYTLKTPAEQRRAEKERAPESSYTHTHMITTNLNWVRFATINGFVNGQSRRCGSLIGSTTSFSFWFFFFPSANITNTFGISNKFMGKCVCVCWAWALTLVVSIFLSAPKRWVKNLCYLFFELISPIFFLLNKEKKRNVTNIRWKKEIKNNSNNYVLCATFTEILVKSLIVIISKWMNK